MISRRLPLLIALLLVWTSSAAEPDSREISVFVTLEGEPAAAIHTGRLQPAAAMATLQARRLELTLQQDTLEPKLAALGGRVTERFNTLVNAVVVRVPAAQLTALRKLPGVRGAREERQYRPLLETSVPFVGAPAAWKPAVGSPLGAGDGMRIGIVDTGIDYLHADFGGDGDPDTYGNNDPTVIESGTFPTAKVVGGYDFVGDDYDSRGEEGSTTAKPDPDPLDPAANGHGTHVAGITAGFGVLTNGLTYTGPYDTAVSFSSFLIGPGVAPRAKLYAYKVFGKGGSTSASAVVKALERCLDPNQDGAFSDHLDVVNVSLGSPFGIADGTDPEVEAINNLATQGVIVVIACGNDGNTHYIVGAPAVATRGIAVANSLDDGASFSTIKIIAPAAVAGAYTSVEGTFTKPLTEVGPLTAQVVQTDPALGCDPIRNSAALLGKIALMDRGVCFFTDKVRAAQLAGAIGVIVVNNVGGPPIVMGPHGDTADITIPGVMISQQDGAILKSQLGRGLTATLDAFAAVARPELADQLSESSSRGPSAADGRLKPDLAAPGTSIKSAKAGTGTEGVVESGTSMSAPHVAGAAALVRAARPSWSVEDIKAALMNTTVATRSDSKALYPESRTGAGRLQVDAAVNTLVIAKADTGIGDVSISFGAYELAEPLSLIRNVRVVNNGALPATFGVSTGQTVREPGATVTALPTSVTVAGKSSVLVAVRLDLDPAKLINARDETTAAILGDKARYHLGETSGQVWFTNASQQLHVPWHVVARPVAQFQATAKAVGLPADAVATVPLPTRGPSAHGQPLVSVFQSGFEGSVGSGDAGDLLAAGAASDFAATHDLEQTHIFFGIATAGKWTTPQYELFGLEVEIDLDGDGLAEFLIVNSSGGNLNGQGVDSNLSNDALLSLVADFTLPKDYFIASEPLNVFPPAVRDTAAYHNRVVVHSASAKAIGLTATQTRFSYRVTTTGTAQTESSWIEFDAAKPIIDATPHGLQHTPFFDEGGGVSVDVNRGAAALAGFTAANPPKALLLHQHNVAGQQAERVSLLLGTADSDNDGLPDAWELANFGDLNSNGSGDADGDGQSNAVEFAAGTNPLDTRMLSPVTATGTLRWVGSAGRNYTLERATALSGSFEPVARQLVGVAGTNSFTDPDLAAGGGTFFYRVRPE